MPVRRYQGYSLEELEEIQEQWEIIGESEEEQDFRQDWVEKGIEIFEAIASKE